MVDFQVGPPNTSVQQPVGFNLNIIGVPWGDHVLLLDKMKSVDQSIFYINQTIENKWSRAILTLQIEQNLYIRQGKAITNFEQTLPITFVELQFLMFISQ